MTEKETKMEQKILKVGKELAAKLAERKPLCSRCGVRPRIQKQAYCRECRATLSLEWYHKKHPEAKRCNPAAAAEKRKQRAQEEARTAARRRRFRELEAWCRAEGIRELARRVK